MRSLVVDAPLVEGAVAAAVAAQGDAGLDGAVAAAAEGEHAGTGAGARPSRSRCG